MRIDLDQINGIENIDSGFIFQIGDSTTETSGIPHIAKLSSKQAISLIKNEITSIDIDTDEIDGHIHTVNISYNNIDSEFKINSISDYNDDNKDSGRLIGSGRQIKIYRFEELNEESIVNENTIICYNNSLYKPNNHIHGKFANYPIDGGNWSILISYQSNVQGNLASKETAGIVSIGDGIDIDNTGSISLAYTPYTVYFGTQKPSYQILTLNQIRNDDYTDNDLIVMNGFFNQIFLTNINYNISAYNCIIRGNAWFGENATPLTITIDGIHVKGTTYLDESTYDGTANGHIITLNRCYFNEVQSWNAASGGSRDLHTFNNCVIGNFSTGSRMNGTYGHRILLNKCTIGEKTNSGYLFNIYDSTTCSMQVTDSTIILNDTSTVYNPVSVYPYLKFINCTVIKADGSSYRLDNTSVESYQNVVDISSSSIVTFDKNREYNPISSGTFTLDDTNKITGAVVYVYLTPSATEPVIPTNGYQSKDIYVSGKNLMYMFKVGANGNIQYKITELD